MIGHYAIWATPLARAYPTISRSSRGGLVLQLSKVLWFLVVHELAHVKLGHLESSPEDVRHVHVLPALALDEGHNGLKLREFAADEYIIESLAPSVRHTFLSWVLLPMQMFCSLERLLTNYRDTHPMAINRLNNLRSKAVGMDRDAFTDVIEDVLARQMEAQRAYGTSSRNLAFHSSHELALASLVKMQDYADYSAQLDQWVPDPDSGKHAAAWDAITDHFGNDDDG